MRRRTTLYCASGYDKMALPMCRPSSVVRHHVSRITYHVSRITYHAMITLVLSFSFGTLQSALRRYLAQPSLEVGEVVPRKLGGGFSGSPVYKLKIGYYGESGDPGELSLVFQEGAQGTGALSYSVAGREANVN